MNKPIIYLDMDGVLANFFAEYAKMAGVTSGNYRDIPDDKVTSTLDAMIGTDFFARLPMFPNVPNLLKLVLSYTDSYSICSSPLRGDGSNSEKWKKVWIKKHLNPQPAEIVITSNKPKWATQPDGTPNILIDDRGLNINGWNNAGGIGIKYQADEDSLEIVKRGLDKAFADRDGQDADAQDEPVEEGELIINPKSTFLTKSDTAYDFLRVGKIISNLTDVEPDANRDEPDVMIVPYGGEKEKEHLKKGLKRVGYTTQDADNPGDDAHVDDEKIDKIYDRKSLPQIRKKELTRIPHTVETVELNNLIPSQNELIVENLQKQFKHLKENRFAPIVVDKDYRIINGHHRYEVLKQLNSSYAEVACIPFTLEEVKSVMEKWSAKYKKSINCSNPKGFSQKAHCAGKKK